MTVDLTERRCFGEPGAMLALAEEHFGRSYDAPTRAVHGAPLAGLLEDILGSAGPTHRVRDGVALVDVQGPLDQRAGWFWDGYDSVTDRVRAALADENARAVLLVIDSPGGVVSGNLACARSLRAMADAAGKPLCAHADTWATSAAYAIACAADRVSVAEDGAIGSIGVIATVMDRTRMTSEMGLDVRVVRSGTLKADPHPDVPLTDASVARVRARVDSLAQSFAEWVSERRGVSAADLLGLKGATIYAPQAQSVGLADAVCGLSDALDAARSMADARAMERRRKTMEDKSTRALAAICEAVGATDPDAAVARVQAAVTTAAEVPALRGRLEALETERHERAVASALDGARRRGALTPAMEGEGTPSAKYIAGRVAARDTEGLEAYLAALPSQVATVAVEPAKVPDAPGKKAHAVTDRDREFAASVGVSTEALEAVAASDAKRRAAREEN